jgi:Domain of unknown function (DUF4338)
MFHNNTVQELYKAFQVEDTEDNGEFSLFNPKLTDSYKRRFTKIVENILDQLPSQRVSLLEDVLNENIQLVNNHDNPIECLKFLSAISILRDLLSQGWRIKKNKNSLFELAPPKLGQNDNKLYLRKQLQCERNAQLKTKSIEKFIKRMEKKKTFNGKEISIRALIGDSQLLYEKVRNLVNEKDMAKRLEASKDLVSPYIQLVTDERCPHTGYRLRDIWRYFRYTWSIPYKSTPGRNMFYLIRDSSQPFHPIVGIIALGNTVLHLTKRDDYIGWTLEAIKKNLKKRVKIEKYEEMLKGNLGLTRKVEKVIPLETDKEYEQRIIEECTNLLDSIKSFIDGAINEINLQELATYEEINNPSEEVIQRLEDLAEQLRQKQFNNKRSKGEVDWKAESNSPLFKKKRAQELSKLLYAKMIIRQIEETESDPVTVIKKLISFQSGKVLNVALQANRKKKIGSNMMEIIVCGAIPPYNELLAGKLVSILAMSPTIVKQYNERYSNQVSEIASRMKGSEVIRDSHLAFLGTTSLYQVGSSQYNRIKVPAKYGFLEYRKLGETEGFGSVFFSNPTSSLISKMLVEIEGGRRINNVFGEGTSPRMRLIRSGLACLGISEQFTKHHTKRIVYGIELASNTKEFLNGKDCNLNYYYPLDGNEEKYTQEMIDFWRKRWLIKRIDNVNILERLSKFNPETVLVSSYI